MENRQISENELIIAKQDLQNVKIGRDKSGKELLNVTIEINRSDAPTAMKVIKKLFLNYIHGSNPIIHTNKIDAQNENGDVTSTSYICRISVATRDFKHVCSKLEIVLPHANEGLKKSGKINKPKSGGGHRHTQEPDESEQVTRIR